MSAIEFEPTDVKDLTMPERTVIEGANVIDYDVEYGNLPVNSEQLAAPTYNVGVPAQGTLGEYETDGEGDSEKYEVDTISLKSGGVDYVADEIVSIKGISPSDKPATIKIKTVEPTIYSIATATASGDSMAGYAKNETIQISSNSEGVDAVLTIASVEPTFYSIKTATASGTMSGYVDGETITIRGAEDDTPAVLTMTVEEGAITALTVTTPGAFDTDIAGTVSSYTYTGTGTGLVLSVTTEVNADAGAIKSLTVTTAGEFPTNIAGVIDSDLITYSGSGTGAVITTTTSRNADGGEILSIELKSKGEYCKDLSGDFDIISSHGTGGKVTVDMEKIDPSAE